MVTLKNDFLEVRIAEQGAELKSLKSNGKEYIWVSDPDVWQFSCPLLFPICGGLKGDKYVLDGREYALKKHGFARRKLFTAESQSEDSAVFLLSSDSETKSSYPFDFELRVTYTLIDKTVKIDYSVKNIGDTPMYFNIGSHEGYYAPDGIEEFDIVFPQAETLNSTVLDGVMLTNDTIPIINNSSVLPLKEDYFEVDALVFTELKSRSLTLQSRNDSRSVRVDFPDDKYLLLWQVHGAPFICVEPWNGIPDRVGSSYDITEKEGITELSAHSEFRHTHSITVVK